MKSVQSLIHISNKIVLAKMNSPGINEDKFILNVSRTCLSENNILILKTLCSEAKLNWEVLALKAANHNLSALIYYSLTKYNLGNLVPKKIFELMKNEYYKTAIINTEFIGEINRLSDIIDVKIVLLKGADLIQNVYPNIAIRPMYDIDILVQKQTAECIWKDLQNHGFKSKGTINVFKSAVHGKYQNQQPVHLCGLYNDKYLLEIHWNLFINENLYYLTLKALDSAHNFKDNLYLLSNEMMVVYLCFHFYRHSKRSAMLRMLCDINEMILKYEKILDWNEIKNICRGTELEYIIKFSLTITSVMLNTSVPEEFILKEYINRKYITLDRFTFREKTEDVVERFRKRLKIIYKFNELLIFVYRTFVPEKMWIMYTYNISSIKMLWKGYLKYWKYLFVKYLLFGRI